MVRAITSGKFPIRNAHPPHIPKKIVAIINKCLQLQPSNRARSALEIINALADIDGNILDWQYSFDETKQMRIWEKTVDGKRFKLQVLTDHSSIATKEANDRETKISAYCKKRIDVEDIRNFLEKH